MLCNSRYIRISALLLMLVSTVFAYSIPDVQLGMGEEHTFTLDLDTISGDIEYSWFVDGVDQMVNAPEITLSWDERGTYILSASYVVNGCSSPTSQIEIEVTFGSKCPDIIPAKYFTPNGDGDKDTWEIENIECYPDAHIEIYDRFSRCLIKYRGIDKGWDGNYNGHPMPSDDYWYYIRDILLGHPRSGHFILKRY
ncbi:MAG: T9SS type B sorting domain-containing protein [Paludibacteraceae bacterium]|nr:T9SS type B sorting domain-containing protein [Paludibacteraceae bacterium]